MRLDGLNCAQPNLRRPGSQREKREGAGAHVHEPPSVRAEEIRWPVRNTGGERRIQELGKGSTSALPWPLESLGVKVWGGWVWWNRGGQLV